MEAFAWSIFAQLHTAYTVTAWETAFTATPIQPVLLLVSQPSAQFPTVINAKSILFTVTNVVQASLSISGIITANRHQSTTVLSKQFLPQMKYFVSPVHLTMNSALTL